MFESMAQHSTPTLAYAEEQALITWVLTIINLNVILLQTILCI